MTRLNKKQQKIVMKWINNEADEKELAKKYHISYKQLSKWIKSKFAQEQIQGKIETAKKNSQILIAKYLPVATAKLITLCNSDNNETSRKACMDLINGELQDKNAEVQTEIEITKSPAEKIDDETAAELLEVIAKSKKRNKTPPAFGDRV